MIPEIDQLYLLCYGSLMLLYIRSLWKTLLMAWRSKKPRKWEIEDSTLLLLWNSVSHTVYSVDEIVLYIATLKSAPQILVCKIFDKNKWIVRVNTDGEIFCSARNGVYVNVVARVREAFETGEVIRLDCAHVGTSDCKRIGVKLRVLLLFSHCFSCLQAF